MTYALVQEGLIVSIGIPPSARRVDTREWVLGLPDAPEDIKAACGYLPVVETPRPADTATESWDFSRAVVDGRPTEMWTKRRKTDDELNPPKSPDMKLVEARAVLDQIATLPAPTLTADVVDLLDNLRSVL